MARYEGRMQAGSETPLDVNELLMILGRDPTVDRETRRNAIACYLAGGDGWRDALKSLGGTFADGLPELTDPKGE
ncbi:MAG TPA: hypothetical protein VNR68_04095 [Sphingomicrobium sp.]|nr:hypothetical protein [Sphingomicrobium sp.]